MIAFDLRHIKRRLVENDEDNRPNELTSTAPFFQKYQSNDRGLTKIHASWLPSLVHRRDYYCHLMR